MNGAIFEGKKNLLNTRRVFWFSLQLLCENNSDFKKTWARNDYRSSCSACHVRLQWNSNSLYRYSKNAQIPNYMKIRLARAPAVPCGRTDGQTWRD